MSESLSKPWIREYLIEIAETYGGQLLNIPSHAKTKRSQLIKFLTFPAPGSDTRNWAMLSDKEYTIPIRFSNPAMEEYRQNAIYGDKPITEFKTAMILIKQFSPFFARVPLGSGRGMSQKSRIALDIGWFELKGAFGEGTWGDPKEVEEDATIREWTEGLTTGGGGGNILKLRKQQQEEASESAPNDKKPTERIVPRSPVSPPKPKLQQARKTVGARMNASKSAEQSSANGHFGRIGDRADPMKEWVRSWRPIALNPIKYALPPSVTQRIYDPISDHEADDMKSASKISPNKPESRLDATTTPNRGLKRKRHALDISSSPSSSSSRSHTPEAVPGTPSHWSPSIIGSQARLPSPASPALTSMDVRDGPKPASPVVVDESLMQVDGEEQHLDGQPPEPESPSFERHMIPEGSLAPTDGADVSSYLTAPTPAQRPKSIDPVLILPNALSPPGQSVVNNSDKSMDLSPSSPPATRRRKVSRKGQPFPLNPDMSGPGRILVPNSDTSGTASQSQSQEQARRYSQSLSYTSTSQAPPQGPSQSQSQSQSQSKAQMPSQLRNEVLPSLEKIDSPASPPKGPNAGDLAEEFHPAAQASSPRPAEGEISPRSVRSQPREDQSPIRSPSPGPVIEAIRSHGSPEAASQSSMSDTEEVEDDGVVDGNESIDEDGGAGSSSSSQVDQLDSDDARTDALIENYEAERPAHVDLSPAGHDQDRLIPPQDDSPSPVKSHEVGPLLRQARLFSQNIHARSSPCEGSSSLPARPSSPDVFMSEASFRRLSSARSTPPRPAKLPPLLRASTVSDIQISPQVKQASVVGEARPSDTKARIATTTNSPKSNHDPEAWSKPSFMRSGERSVGQQTNIPRARKRKRADNQPIVNVSSSPRDEKSPPAKKQKLSAPSARDPKPAQSSKTSIPPTESLAKADSLDSTISKIRHIDLRRSVSVASTSSLSKKQAKPMDRTAATASTSQAHALASARPSQVSSKGKARQADASSSLRRSKLSESGADSDPHPPQTGAPSKTRSKGSFQSGGVFNQTSARASAPAYGPRAGSSREAESEPPDLTGTAMQITGKKLGGYTVKLDFTRKEGELPLITWTRLVDVLLKTGKSRYKEANRLEGTREAPR